MYYIVMNTAINIVIITILIINEQQHMNKLIWTLNW